MLLHADQPHNWHDLARAWSFDPLVVIPLVITAAVFTLGKPRRSEALFFAYIGLTASWGLTPLEDQQIGGLIVWIPAGLVYVIAGLALFAGWLREAELRTESL